MSGPVTAADTPPHGASPAAAGPPAIEVLAAREVLIGTHVVQRLLPQRGRRTVGAWCFADHMGSDATATDSGLGIGPHPHIGLHTVTWLMEGEVLHRDSLGSEQVIRPGQLNLMSAGHGVAHAEESATSSGPVRGVQLWVAQPESTRHGSPAFEHHAELPRMQLDHAAATVLVGTFGTATSPARADTPLLGVDLVLGTGTSACPLRADFEHAVLVVEGTVLVDGQPVAADHVAYLGLGRDLVSLGARDRSRVLLLGGAPFAEPLLMWWNFVARDRAEMEEATRQWNAADARFGSVASPLARIPASSIPPGLRA